MAVSGAVARDSGWWDRVYTVMDMASEDGNWPTYMNRYPCGECGSEFAQHRCHLEDKP